MPRASAITHCPWCRKPVDPGALRCAHCGFKLRQPRIGGGVPKGPPGQPRFSPAQRLWRRLAPLRSRLAGLSWPQVAIGSVPLVLLAVWFVATYPVRSELRRVEAHLESLPELRDVDFGVPLFATRMPQTVYATATGLPSGYAYEVKVELKGTYTPATRTAHFTGIKQVLSPYEKVRIDRDWAVPPP